MPISCCLLSISCCLLSISSCLPSISSCLPPFSTTLPVTPGTFTLATSTVPTISTPGRPTITTCPASPICSWLHAGHALAHVRLKPWRLLPCAGWSHCKKLRVRGGIRLRLGDQVVGTQRMIQGLHKSFIHRGLCIITAYRRLCNLRKTVPDNILHHRLFANSLFRRSISLSVTLCQSPSLVAADSPAHRAWLKTGTQPAICVSAAPSGSAGSSGGRGAC